MMKSTIPDRPHGGRPPEGREPLKQMATYLVREQAEAVQRAADAEGVSNAEIIRRALTRYLGLE